MRHSAVARPMNGFPPVCFISRTPDGLEYPMGHLGSAVLTGPSQLLVPPNLLTGRAWEAAKSEHRHCSAWLKTTVCDQRYPHTDSKPQHLEMVLLGRKLTLSQPKPGQGALSQVSYVQNIWILKLMNKLLRRRSAWWGWQSTELKQCYHCVYPTQGFSQLPGESPHGYGHSHPLGHLCFRRWTSTAWCVVWKAAHSQPGVTTWKKLFKSQDLMADGEREQQRVGSNSGFDAPGSRSPKSEHRSWASFPVI